MRIVNALCISKEKVVRQYVDVDIIVDHYVDVDIIVEVFEPNSAFAQVGEILNAD